MSCEQKNLNRIPKDSFKAHYLFHSEKARDSGITGEESGLELERALSNTDVKRMAELDRFYRERFSIPITEDLLKDMARFLARQGKRRFFR